MEKIPMNYEIMFPDPIAGIEELTIEINSLPELVSTLAGIKELGGVYIGEGDLPQRLWRVELAVYPKEKIIRGIVMLDEEELDQRGNVRVTTPEPLITISEERAYKALREYGYIPHENGIKAVVAKANELAKIPFQNRIELASFAVSELEREKQLSGCPDHDKTQKHCGRCYHDESVTNVNTGRIARMVDTYCCSERIEWKPNGEGICRVCFGGFQSEIEGSAEPQHLEYFDV